MVLLIFLMTWRMVVSVTLHRSLVEDLRQMRVARNLDRDHRAGMQV